MPKIIYRDKDDNEIGIVTDGIPPKLNDVIWLVGKEWQAIGIDHLITPAEYNVSVTVAAYII